MVLVVALHPHARTMGEHSANYCLRVVGEWVWVSVWVCLWRGGVKENSGGVTGFTREAAEGGGGEREREITPTFGVVVVKM